MSILVPVLSHGSEFSRATKDQKDAIVAFQRSAIESVPENYYASGVKAAWWRTRAMGLDKLIASGSYFVIAIAGQLVAGAGWEPYQNERTALLRAVFVDPEYFGIGLGVRAVRQVETDLVENGRVNVVIPAALNAVRFYEKLGYVAGESAETEYEPGVTLDHRVMRKVLGSNKRKSESVCSSLS